MDRMYNMAAELAKKDLKFKDEDREDQDKLKILLFKTAENEEVIRDQLRAVLHAIKANNPNMLIDSDVRNEVLVEMEKRVYTGEINSISTLQSVETIGELATPVIQRQEFEADVSEMLEESVKVGGAILLTEALTEKLIEGKLTDKQLDDLGNMIRNSKEARELDLNDHKKLFDKDVPEEEKINAARNLGDARFNQPSEYFMKNKTPQAMRGAYFQIARLYTSNSPISKQLAKQVAGKYGLLDIFGDNNDIDMDKVFERFRECIKGDSRLEERYNSREAFEREVSGARDRGAQNILNLYMKDIDFETEWNKCKTDEERENLMIRTREQRKRDGDNLRSISKYRDAGETEKLAEVINELSQSPRKDMKRLLYEIANGQKDPEAKEFILKELQEIYGEREDEKSQVIPESKDDGESR